MLRAFQGGDSICQECKGRLLFTDFSTYSGEIHNEILGKIFQVSCSPVRQGNGPVSRIVHIARDITEEKKMEAVRLQSQKMEAIGTLTGGIAHDFNNILTTILGCSQIVRDAAPETDPSRERKDHVYIIPPGKELTISKSRLHMADLHDHIATGSLIDTLMGSLADDRHDQAIAIGLADFVLPPDTMQEIIQILRAETSHDFSLYKTNTIARRIERRMHIHQLDTLREYVELLHSSKYEISVLFKELLIGVTSFFREPEVFALLKKTFLPELLQHKTGDNQIRVWVPGCSTGEEAYSLAMVLTECMETLALHLEVQVFGTDLDASAIDTEEKACIL